LYDTTYGSLLVLGVLYDQYHKDKTATVVMTMIVILLVVFVFDMMIAQRSQARARYEKTRTNWDNFLLLQLGEICLFLPVLPVPPYFSCVRY
jgi:hypothetical protein